MVAHVKAIMSSLDNGSSREGFDTVVVLDATRLLEDRASHMPGNRAGSVEAPAETSVDRNDAEVWSVGCE